MRPTQLSSLLAASFKHRQKVLINGMPGIGKSDIVAQAAADIQADLLISHPAVSDPTDYKGMPAVLPDGRAEFLPFGDLDKLIKANRPTINFLDDIGHAPPAVQAALMQLLLARRVNGHKISDHVVFCGATNDTKHMAGVAGMLEPVKFREPASSAWLKAPPGLRFATVFLHGEN
jgi:MoxR-like ATPase